MKCILRKQTIAPPWAIVRKNLLNKAKPIEEANDRTSMAIVCRNLLNKAKPTEKANDRTSLGDGSQKPPQTP
jgi:hypothetical protein